MAGIDQILYVGIVGLGLYYAYSTGLLDQAGQALVTATAGKGQQQQGFAKHHHKKILVPEIIVPVVRPRMRLTIV